MANVLNRLEENLLLERVHQSDEGRNNLKVVMYARKSDDVLVEDTETSEILVISKQDLEEDYQVNDRKTKDPLFGNIDNDKERAQARLKFIYQLAQTQADLYKNPQMLNVVQQLELLSEDISAHKEILGEEHQTEEEKIEAAIRTREGGSVFNMEM